MKIQNLITIKNIVIALVVLYGFILGINYLKVSNTMLKETINNNTFQRRLMYENALIQNDIKCRELGNKLGYEMYFSITRKNCVPELRTGDLMKDTESSKDKYRGLINDIYVKDYNFLFRKIIELPIPQK